MQEGTLRPDVATELLLSQYTLLSGGLLQAIRLWWWFILITTVVIVGSTLGLSLMQTPEYEASIKILIEPEQESGTPGNLGSDVQGIQELSRTVAEIVDSPPVTEGVVRQLNLQIAPEELEENLTVEQIPETQLVEVDYRDPSPTQAQKVADTVGDVTYREVAEMTLSPATPIVATTWQRADVTDEPVSPNLLLNLSLALIVGVTLGVALALLMEYLGLRGGD